MEDSKSYAKGYAAGRKKQARDADENARIAARYKEIEAFRRAVFLAALPEIIKAPWQTNGKTQTTADEMVRTAASFADEAVKRIIR